MQFNLEYLYDNPWIDIRFLVLIEEQITELNYFMEYKLNLYIVVWSKCSSFVDGIKKQEKAKHPFKRLVVWVF